MIPVTESFFMKTNILLGLVLVSGANALAQSTTHLEVEELRQVRLPDVVLDSVEPVAPDRQKNPGAAAYLQVKGTIGGTIRFELLLPEAWNGRFAMGGGG